MKTKTFYFKVHGRYNGIESDTEADIKDKLYNAFGEAGFVFQIDNMEV